MRRTTVASVIMFIYTAYTSRWTQIVSHYIQQLQRSWPNTYVLKAFPDVIYDATNKLFLILTVIFLVISIIGHINQKRVEPKKPSKET